MSKITNNKQKKIEKRKQRKIKQTYNKLCIQPAFTNDILPLILNLRTYSENDLSSMELVSKKWCILLNDNYKKMKKIIITIKHGTKQDKFDCYTFSDKDAKELCNCEGYYVKCWSYKTLTTLTTSQHSFRNVNIIDGLYIICSNCKKDDLLYSLFLDAACKYCYNQKYETSDIKYNFWGERI